MNRSKEARTVTRVSPNERPYSASTSVCRSVVCSGVSCSLNTVPNEAVGTSRRRRSIRAGHGQALEVQAAVKLSDAFAIEPLCHAVVGRRRIECRKVEPSDAIAVLVGARQRHVHAIREAVPHGGPDQPGPQRSGLDRDRAAAKRRAGPRNHVHHGEERAVAVERRGGPADDFHTLEHRGIEAELGADFRLPVTRCRSRGVR